MPNITDADLKEIDPDFDSGRLEKTMTLSEASLFDLKESTPQSVLSKSGEILLASLESSVIETATDAGATYPTTRQEQVQEFINGFGKLGKLYHDTTDSDSRLGKFQGRMEGVYQDDRRTFLDLAKIGDDLTGNSPPSPKEVGDALGQAMADAIIRKANAGTLNWTGADMANLQGAIAGMMLAAGSKFDEANKMDLNKQLVDGFDESMKAAKLPFIRGIIWGDTKEPGLAITDQEIDRHNFLP